MLTSRHPEVGAPLFSRFLRGVRRHPVLLFGLISLLAVALLLTVLPKSTSQAAETASGITWQPGRMALEEDSDGQCYGVVNSSVAVNNDKLATVLTNTFRTLAPYDDGEPDGFGTATIEEASSNTGTVAIESKLAVDCKIAFGEEGAVRGRKLLPVPEMANGGLSSLGGNVMYVLVGAVVIAGISLALGPAALEQSVYSAVAGCVGGAAMTSSTHLLSGASPGWKGGLISGVAGCISGASFALLPVKTIGLKIAEAVRPWIGRPVASIVGAELATANGLGATPIARVVPQVLEAVATGAEGAV